MKRYFKKWQPPAFDDNGLTKWNWMCQHHKRLILGRNVDIGAFTYINAKYGVELNDNVQIGSHCSLYSVSTIDNKKGRIVVKKNVCIGTHSAVMPGITIGENSIVGAYTFVNRNIPDNVLVYGIPAKVIRSLKDKKRRYGNGLEDTSIQNLF